MVIARRLFFEMPRLLLLQGSMRGGCIMTSEPRSQGQHEEWICARCQVPLVLAKVNVGYLNSAFPVELPRCPICGQVLISEELATGKMAQAERQLEDK
jgi:hypothetical protein